ncbi:hypothetical protein BC938DRAFT_476316 [Jimgerdemannia flammicorona]|uniref:Uncharacterized protein n=1 Tax=Jimgerdemannia flammicorona TaxID=994334 RepID=A0A433QQN1_9FUNG|nr:hypothetical protein BC938DRAFT_476316 [Jimgerdemannia flammicorona]
MGLLQTLSIFSNTLLKRINETPWTRAFIVATILQAGCVIILESMVLNANQAEYDQLGLFNSAFYGYNNTARIPSFSDTPVVMAVATAPALDRFSRLKYENIFFMAFQAFQLWFTFDALYHHNTIQLTTSSLINLLCAVFGVVQILESQKWLGRVQEIIDSFQLRDVDPFMQAKWIEIVLTFVMIVFALFLMFLAYKLYRQYGWLIYKRIGANIAMQGHFKTYQIFVMLMKLNIFFELGFSVFYLIGMAINNSNWEVNAYSPGLLIFHATVTGMILPMLFIAYHALRNENHYLMWFFIIFNLTAISDFVYILGHSISPNPDENWFFWIFIVNQRPTGALSLSPTGLQEIESSKPTRWAIEDDAP